MSDTKRPKSDLSHLQRRGVAGFRSAAAEPVATVAIKQLSTARAREECALKIAAIVDPTIKRGRGRPKVEGQRPWEAEGVSRMTWWRRKQKEKSERNNGQ